MAWQHDRYMTLTDGREVLICYVVEHLGSEPSGMFGPPEDYDPGSGPELYIEKALHEDGAECSISDAERDRLETIIAENPDWWMPEDDGPDYD